MLSCTGGCAFVLTASRRGVSPDDGKLLQAVVDGSAEFSAISRQAIKDKRGQMAPMLALLDSL
jgi:hypothetical protein